MSRILSFVISTALLSGSTFSMAAPQAVPKVVEEKNAGIVIAKFTNQSTGVFNWIDAASKATSATTLQFVDGKLNDGKFEQDFWRGGLFSSDVVNDYVVINLPAGKDNDRYVVNAFKRGFLTAPLDLLCQNKKRVTAGTFQLKEGEVLYIGDYETADSATIGHRTWTLSVTNHFDDAKRYLDDHYPNLAGKLQQATFDLPYPAQTGPGSCEIAMTEAHNGVPATRSASAVIEKAMALEQPRAREANAPSNEAEVVVNIKLPQSGGTKPAAAPQPKETISSAAITQTPATESAPAPLVTTNVPAASDAATTKTQNAASQVGLTVTQPVASSPVPPAGGKQGTWSYEVEKLANAQGCNSAQSGAWLIGKEDFQERYQVSCAGGKEFIAVCDNIECKQI